MQKKTGSAEQILLDGRGALYWYDLVNQRLIIFLIIYAGSECVHFVQIRTIDVKRVNVSVPLVY